MKNLTVDEAREYSELWQYLAGRFYYLFDSDIASIMSLILYPPDCAYIQPRVYSGWWSVISPDDAQYPKWETKLTTTNDTHAFEWLNNSDAATVNLCTICNKEHTTQTYSYEGISS